MSNPAHKTAPPSLFRLECRAQHYAWGKQGLESKVAELLACNEDQNVEIDSAKPYAELWMGVHPNAPSFVHATKQPLLHLIHSDPNAFLTEKVAKEFLNTLPFLLKILSIRTALSIQAHPDKSLAAKLHKERPDLYKDPNHKPEMAIALTPFEALVGFRPVEEITKFINEYQDFRNVIGEDVVLKFMELVRNGETKNALKTLFTGLMTASTDVVTRNLDTLISKLQSLPISKIKGSLPELLCRLQHQYPGDVGCFSIFLLNVVILNPGQGIYLGANEPHAYISGDCIECMATSDNVVRAGLTPKYKDVETLTSMLTYKSLPAASQISQGVNYRNTKFTKIYDPPIDEFNILYTEIPSTGGEEVIDPIHGPSLVIVTQGSAMITVKETNEKMEFKKGQSWFIAPHVTLTIKSADGDGIVLFRAFCE